MMKPKFSIFFHNENGETIVLCNNIEDEKKAYKIVHYINAYNPFNTFAYYYTYFEEEDE